MSSDLKRRGGGLDSQTQTSHTDESRKCERAYPVMLHCGMAANVRSESHW